MDDSQHTVFISHHVANADAAQAFASMLRSYGAKVACEAYPQSSDAVLARRKALFQSKVLIAWLSTEHCLDPHLQREFMQAFAASARHPARERVVLIDALDAHGASLPAVLRDSCQVTRPDQLSALAEHIATHAKSLANSIGAFETDRHGDAPQEFAPRIGHLWHLHDALAQGGPTGVHAVQLVGDAGSGKTWLANEYVRLFRDAYPGGIFHLDAGWFDQPSSAQLQLMRTLAWREIASNAGIDVDARTDAEIMTELARRLEQRNVPYLWIIDHVPPRQALEDVRAWFAPTGLGKTMFMTRTEEYTPLSAHVTIGALDLSEARSLLAQQKPMATEQEAAAGRQLIEQLGAHPLAVQLAATRLARSTYDRMLLQLAAPAREAAQLADGLSETLPHPQLVGIAVAIQRSIARLGTQARHALRLASVLAPAPVPVALLTTALAQQVRNASNHTAVSHTQLAIDELLGFGLAQRADHSTLLIVPLVRQSVASVDSASDLEAARNLIVAILAGELPQALVAARTNPYWHWIPHVLHLARTATPGAQLVELNAWLARFDSIIGPLRSSNRRAIALLEQGDLVAAQQLLDMELAARRIGLGENHPHTVTPVNNLGVALSLRGEFARARIMFEQAIDVRRKALGDSHTDLLTPLNNLGVVLWHEGEHGKARKVFEKVVELRRHVLGDRHPDTLVSMRNLAVALRQDGEYVAARSLLEHVVEVRRASLGQQHVDTCTAMASLAETLREHSEAILARISDTLSLDAPLLGHEGVRIARA
jgi:tetratricopeptide (TPR) repeat protein